MVFTRCDGEIGDPFNAQFVPYGSQITTFVELDLIGDTTSAIQLIRGILQVPSRLRLLNELSNHTSLSFGAGVVINGPPNFEVLDSIALLIFARSLPCYNEGTERGESELVYVFRGEVGYDVSYRGVHDCNTAEK